MFYSFIDLCISSHGSGGPRKALHVRYFARNVLANMYNEHMTRWNHHAWPYVSMQYHTNSKYEGYTET